MAKGGKGVMFEVPLIATENAGTVHIEPDPKTQHWDQKTNTFTFDKSKFKDMRQNDHHYVEFTVAVDKTATGVRFPRDPKNALWVVNQERCPGPNDAKQYDIMNPLAVIGDGTLLAVNFNEQDGQKFGFTVNFVRKNTADDTDPKNYIPWDPVGSNKDGGTV